MADTDSIIAQTQYWVSSVIVKHNFCPFAKRELERGSIRYVVVSDDGIELCLQSLIKECVYLDQHADTETTLLILAVAGEMFDDYLQLLDIAETLLIEQGYEGVYQLASFHPEYIFADSQHEDAANYTNRSPYPMFHIIREASIEKALQHYPNPELIPERNVEVARSLGLELVRSQLDACYHMKKYNQK